MGILTVSDVQKALPSKKNTITEELVDIINKSQEEPEFQGTSLLSTAITYEELMIKNKASAREFVDAIKFCAYLTTMEDNATEAYRRTFSNRKFVMDRMDSIAGSKEYNELTSAASRYKRENRLVIDLLTYSQAPLDIMFTGWRYKAVGVLADVMMNARQDRDKINAAKELIAATKGPENLKIALDIGVKESSAIASLNEQLAEAAMKQKMLLESGSSSLKELGALKPKDDIIDGEIE